MNGLQVGRWTQATNGGHQFSYLPEWLEQPEARPLSLSMPLQVTSPYRGALVEDWFENLLPDNREIRQRMQGRFRTGSIRAFELLAEVGRDCAGAVQLLPEGEEPGDNQGIDGDALTEADVAAVLRATPVSGGSGPDGADGTDFRISLAGTQEKTALLWHDGGWRRPRGATPTTHIFKRAMGRVGNFQGDLATSAENEWLCSRIVASFGLPIAPTEIRTFEDTKALVVERFDRRLAPDGTCWLRLPQEDFCQALKAPASLKYESDGGPGIRPIMDLLLGSRVAGHDRLLFLRTQVVFWLLCAIDGHAKNFSVAIEPEGRFALTPLYDVLSAWPIIGRGQGKLAPAKATMAMAVISKNRHYNWGGIQPRHWLSTAQACGMDGGEMTAILRDLVEQTPRVIADTGTTLPAGFSEDVAGPVLSGLAFATRRLEEGLSTL